MQHDFWIKYALCAQPGKVPIGPHVFRDWHETKEIEEMKKRAERMNTITEDDLKFEVVPFYFAHPRERGMV